MDDSIYPTQNPNQAGANPAPVPSGGTAPAGAAPVSCAPKGTSGQNEAPFDPNRAVEALSTARPTPAVISPRTLRRRFEELARRAALAALHARDLGPGDIAAVQGQQHARVHVVDAVAQGPKRPVAGS